jgi:hypothetical protein
MFVYLKLVNFRAGELTQQNQPSKINRTPLSLNRFGQDIDYRPPLGFAHGPGLLNPHLIASFALVLFVMRFVALGANHNLAVPGVGGAAFDRHDHGFVHLVANDNTDSLFNCHETLLRCCCFELTFPLDRQELRQFMLQVLELVRFLEASGALLKPQLEQGLFDFEHPLRDLFVGFGARFGDVGHCH